MEAVILGDGGTGDRGVCGWECGDDGERFDIWRGEKQTYGDVERAVKNPGDAKNRIRCPAGMYSGYEAAQLERDGCGK